MARQFVRTDGSNNGKENVYSRMVTALTNARIQVENNALYQTIYQIINQTSRLEDQMLEKEAALIKKIDDNVVDNPVPEVYEIGNVVSTRTYDAAVPTLQELSDTLGTLIDDLRKRKIVS